MSGWHTSCLDRYVAKLQTTGGVIWFFHDHRGKPIVSRRCPIGEKFRRDVKDWAQASGIPVIRFKAGERKADVMARTCRPLPRRIFGPGSVSASGSRS